MPSLVEQLLAEALDPNVKIADLLRKTKVVAVKLGRDDIIEWIENELNGYREKRTKEYPEYRKITGKMEFLHPYYGWQPLQFEGPEDERRLSNTFASQSVGELDDLLRNAKEDGFFSISPSPEIKKDLNKSSPIGPVDFHLNVPRPALAGILDSVRNMILDWSLKLEQAGIKGQGISFSQQEKEVAQTATTIHVESITNFAGNIGNVSGQTVVNATQTNTFSEANLDEIRSLLSQMREHLPAVGLGDKDKDSVEKETKIIEDELSAEQPDHPRLRSALSSIGRILQGAAENIIASGVIHQITSLLQ